MKNMVLVVGGVGDIKSCLESYPEYSQVIFQNGECNGQSLKTTLVLAGENGNYLIEEVDESVVEQKIVQNIKQFILQFGTDFLFVGNQYQISVGGHNHKIDLLFFNRAL